MFISGSCQLSVNFVTDEEMAGRECVADPEVSSSNPEITLGLRLCKYLIFLFFACLNLIFKRNNVGHS